MTPVELVGLTVLLCAALFIPFLKWTIDKERSLTQKERNLVEQQKRILNEERRQFFNAIQSKAAANATVQCRTCTTCNRVVHRYRPLGEGVICKECDVESKVIR